MLESAYKLGYYTDFLLLSIYLLSGIVVGILSSSSFNPHNPLRCRFLPQVRSLVWDTKLFNALCEILEWSVSGIKLG